MITRTQFLILCAILATSGIAQLIALYLIQRDLRRCARRASWPPAPSKQDATG